ncbi:MAG: isoprenylcysteine carboxylmethyltransferase family protein [Anaerolineales bacterium]|nr:isoprenylcysteine carboxylmethyltransferase family protein [Anaerolineales bacterium]
MELETIFRGLFILSFLAMSAIRGYYQSRLLKDDNPLDFKEGRLSLIAGSVAALTTIVFGAAYIFAPGAFAFAYALPYPAWLRWLGAAFLLTGLLLLWSAHHHLGLSFHSLVNSKVRQELVQTGPYAWIRHPIYTAYLQNYLGGGLLAGNLILIVIPTVMFALLVMIRMPQEEAVMRERFGQAYANYMIQTGKLLPRLRRHR